MKLYPFLRAVKNRARKGVERKEVAMTVTSETNRKYVQKRTRRAENRARFVGVLYFLGTMALAVLAFLPFEGLIAFFDECLVVGWLYHNNFINIILGWLTVA